MAKKITYLDEPVTVKENITQTQALLDPTSSMDEIKKTLSFIGGAALSASKDVGRALAQGLTFGTYDELAGFTEALLTGRPVDEVIEEYRAPLREFREEFPVAAYGSEMVGSLPYLATSVPRAMGMGAAYGFGAAEGDPVERLPEAAVGGVAGGVLQKLIPTGITPQAAKLRERGIPLTVGQTMGGAVGRLEEGATSAPLVGDFIKARQRRGLEAFNVETLNEALKPLGKQIPLTLTPREAATRVKAIFDAEYAKTLNPIKLKVDDAFISKVISGLDEYDLPERELKEITTNITNSFVNRAKKSEGVLTGQQVREIKTNLGQLGQSMRTATGDYSRQKAMAYTDASNQIMDAVADQFPKQAAELKKLGEAYSRYAPVQDAMFKSKQEGVFTPAQLLSQVQRQARGNKASYLAGEARQQELAEAGMDVLAQKVPDTGTPFRGGLLAGGATMLGGSIDERLLLGGAGFFGGGSALYTPLGQAVARGVPVLPKTMGKVLPSMPKVYTGGAVTTPIRSLRSPSAAGLLGGGVTGLAEDYMNVSP